MGTVTVLSKPAGSKLGFKPIVLTKNERTIVENWFSSQHSVNTMVTNLVIQATRKNGSLDIHAYEWLSDAVIGILMSSRKRKTSPLNVVLELREAFEKINGSSII